MKTISIRISGRVQGVFYRQSTQEIANSLGINGSVRNKSNGDVLVIATGTKEQLEKLVRWCHQGPARAQVASVIVEDLLPENFEGFRILR